MDDLELDGRAVGRGVRVAFMDLLAQPQPQIEARLLLVVLLPIVLLLLCCEAGTVSQLIQSNEKGAR
jgi:hypothetical protein